MKQAAAGGGPGQRAVECIFLTAAGEISRKSSGQARAEPKQSTRTRDVAQCIFCDSIYRHKSWMGIPLL